MIFKFCGKRFDNGDYIFGWFYMEDADTAIIVDSQDCLHLAYVVDFETVGQFIGMIDKNKLEIYTKDIVKITYRDGGFEIGYIDYDDETRRFVVVFPKGDKYGLGGFFNDIEKLGTLKDNPELLVGVN